MSDLKTILARLEGRGVNVPKTTAVTACWADDKFCGECMLEQESKEEGCYLLAIAELLTALDRATEENAKTKADSERYTCPHCRYYEELNASAGGVFCTATAMGKCNTLPCGEWEPSREAGPA